MPILETIRAYVAEGIPEFDSAYAKLEEALNAWYEHWENTYDGGPLKDHEVKLLRIARKLE